MASLAAVSEREKELTKPTKMPNANGSLIFIRVEADSKSLVKH
jgi:hypothetical protein